MASTLTLLAAVLRALATLVSELLLGSSRLPPSRLSVRPRAVSHARGIADELAASDNGKRIDVIVSRAVYLHCL